MVNSSLVRESGRRKIATSLRSLDATSATRNDKVVLS